jgi:hypothetical protein
VRSLSQGNYSIAIASAIGVLVGLAYALDIGRIGTRTLSALRGDDPAPEERSPRHARWTRGYPQFLKRYFSSSRGFHQRLPSWIFRALGLYVIAVSIGVFVLAPSVPS